MNEIEEFTLNFPTLDKSDLILAGLGKKPVSSLEIDLDKIAEVETIPDEFLKRYVSKDLSLVGLYSNICIFRTRKIGRAVLVDVAKNKTNLDAYVKYFFECNFDLPPEEIYGNLGIDRRLFEKYLIEERTKLNFKGRELLIGLLLGYPETAVRACLGELQRIEEKYVEIPPFFRYDGSCFLMSKNHFKEELKILREWDGLMSEEFKNYVIGNKDRIVYSVSDSCPHFKHTLI